MSKLNLVDISEQHFSAELISNLIEAFRLKTTNFPTALLVSRAQAEKYFYQAGEILTNFHGVPIEIEKRASENATIVKTINGILSGMHLKNVTDVSQIYAMLEEMKGKFDA